MVMHARKIPRLDENYRDAGHADLLGKEKALITRSSSKYSDRKQYEEDDRKKDSPRSFKGRCEDRRAYESNKRSKTHKQRDHKSDVHRLAERVCGDWSEHISKSGKRYFYNCLTEVSQWHKPESWIEEDPPSTQSKSEDRTSNDGSYNSKDNQSSRKNRPRNDHHKQHNHRVDWRAGRLSSSRSPNRKNHRSGSEDERGRRKEYRKDDRLSDHPLQQSNSSKNCMYQDMDISPTSSPQASKPSSHTPINKHTSHQHINHKHTTPHDMKEARLNNNDSANNNTRTLSSSAVPNDIHDVPDEPIRDNNDTPTTPSKPPTTEAGVGESTPQGLQSTLAGLQRAVLQLNSDNNITHNNNSFASCVALLPVLLTQLSNPQSSNQATNQENQLIIQQAIPLLKKLQEMVVHQQQQQQQRKLQAMLLQLLQMQKADKPPEQPPPKEKAESPYSPPDSDGSPVDHKHTSPHKQPVVSSSIEPIYTSNTITTATTTTSATLPVLSSLSSVASSSPSFKYSMSTHQSLSRQTTPPTPLLPTPSRQPEAHHDVLSVMSCYVNNKLTEHVTNWNIESLNKQASCYSAEKFIAYGALCSQISPELKHARSMVRCHEILSTIHEQRVSSVRQQYYELERGVSILPGSAHPSHQTSFSTPFNQQHYTPQQHILKNQTHQVVNHPLTSPTHQPAESPIGQTIVSPVLQQSNLTQNTNQKVSTPMINNLSPSIQSKIEPFLTAQTSQNNLSSPSTLNPVVASVTTDNNT